MASKYYNDVGKEVYNGDTAEDADLNDINTAVDTAFELVETDLDGVLDDVIYYTDLAQKWAENPEDTQVDTGQYSSLHWSIKSSDSAAAASTSESNASTSETNADTSETNASTSETNAATSETNAGLSEDAAKVSEDNAKDSEIAAEAAAAYTTVPVGCVLPFIGGNFTNGSNGGFTNRIGNTAAAVNALLNSTGFYVCNGAALNDPTSSIFNGSGRYLPNLTDDRYLQGDTAAGTIGGSSTMDHTHTLSHTHTVSSHNHTMAHTHTIASHDHTTASMALALSQIPSHDHTIATTASDTAPVSSVVVQQGRTAGTVVNGTTGSAGSGGSHTHGNTGTKVSVTSSESSADDTGTKASSTTSAASTSTTSAASVTENRPKFLSCIYIMKVN